MAEAKTKGLPSPPCFTVVTKGDCFDPAAAFAQTPYGACGLVFSSLLLNSMLLFLVATYFDALTIWFHKASMLGFFCCFTSARFTSSLHELTFICFLRPLRFSPLALVNRKEAKIEKYADTDLRLGVRVAACVERLLTPTELKYYFTPIAATTSKAVATYDPNKKVRPKKSSAGTRHGIPLLNMLSHGKSSAIVGAGTGSAAEEEGEAGQEEQLLAVTHEVRLSKLSGLLLPAMALSPRCADVHMHQLVVRPLKLARAWEWLVSHLPSTYVPGSAQQLVRAFRRIAATQVCVAWKFTPS